MPLNTSLALSPRVPSYPVAQAGDQKTIRQRAKMRLGHAGQTDTTATQRVQSATGSLWTTLGAHMSPAAMLIASIIAQSINIANHWDDPDFDRQTTAGALVISTLGLAHAAFMYYKNHRQSQAIQTANQTQNEAAAAKPFATFLKESGRMAKMCIDAKYEPVLPDRYADFKAKFFEPAAQDGTIRADFIRAWDKVTQILSAPPAAPGAPAALTEETKLALRQHITSTIYPLIDSYEEPLNEHYENIGHPIPDPDGVIVQQ